MSPKELFDGENVKTAVIPGSVPLKTTDSDFEVLGIDHVDLTVTDTAKSLPFYEKVLGRLGFRRLVHPRYHGFHNAHLIIGIKQADEGGKTVAHNRFRPGLHHLALKAKERDDIDRFHDFLKSEGLTILDKPTYYPAYGPDYYAIFFSDPDGIKLELVHYPLPWSYWLKTQTTNKD